MKENCIIFQIIKKKYVTEYLKNKLLNVSKLKIQFFLFVTLCNWQFCLCFIIYYISVFYFIQRNSIKKNININTWTRQICNNNKKLLKKEVVVLIQNNFICASKVHFLHISTTAIWNINWKHKSFQLKIQFLSFCKKKKRNKLN